MDLHTILKWCGECLSWGVIIGTMIGWLPKLAAGLSLVWTAIQIYEWWNKKK